MPQLKEVMDQLTSVYDKDISHECRIQVWENWRATHGVAQIRMEDSTPCGTGEMWVEWIEDLPDGQHVYYLPERNHFCRLYEKHHWLNTFSKKWPSIKIVNVILESFTLDTQEYGTLYPSLQSAKKHIEYHNFLRESLEHYWTEYPMNTLRREILPFLFHQ